MLVDCNFFLIYTPTYNTYTLQTQVVREGSYWVYQKGSLQDYSGPLA